MYTLAVLIPWRPLILLLIAVLAFTGCDSDNGDPTQDDIVTFQGRVTDEAGFGKRAGAVEGAVVTAANLGAAGSLQMLLGEAETDVDGRFTFEAVGASDVVVLTARKDAFRSDVLVFHERDGTGAVRAMPMTVETKAEAAVYAASVERGSAGDVVTAAAVAAYVNQRLAAEWEAGRATAAEIAAALDASAQAEAAYFAENDEADINPDTARREEHQAFLTVQTDLHEAATVAAQAAALAAFEQALVEASTEAGASLEAQAKARQSGQTALLKFFNASTAEARLALRQQAEILTSLATAMAIETAFAADGAPQARLDALAEARATLVATLRAASSETQIEAARAAYQAGVEAEVMAALNIDAVVLAAVETVLATAKATLDASVDAAGSAGAVASAYAVFYPSAETAAETALVTSNNASLGAHVLALLNARSS